MDLVYIFASRQGPFCAFFALTTTLVNCGVCHIFGQKQKRSEVMTKNGQLIFKTGQNTKITTKIRMKNLELQK
jgi:hypothetical protein